MSRICVYKGRSTTRIAVMAVLQGKLEKRRRQCLANVALVLKVADSLPQLWARPGGVR